MVASPPRIWRSRLFVSSISFTAGNIDGLIFGSFSVRSLCTVVTKAKIAAYFQLVQKIKINVYFSAFNHSELAKDLPEMGVDHNLNSI